MPEGGGPAAAPWAGVGARDGADRAGRGEPGPDTDIVVVEDVWGAPFEGLAARFRARRSPDAWRSRPGLVEAAAGARALVVRNRARVDAEVLAALPALQMVARAGSGLDNIDLAAADRLGVVVSAPLGANAVSVAEHAVGLALALARRTLVLDRAARDGCWRREGGRELAGRTWGIVGFGATGRAVARLALAFGMRVLAHDPYVGPDGGPRQVRLCGLEEVVAAADVLSLHVPAAPGTRRLVDAGLLDRLPPGALLVNLARGDVVDEDALADALESGHLGGAALDVRASEPPTPGRLERLDNVVLTPHVGGITAESQHRIAAALATDIAAVLDGAAARCAVGAAARGRQGSRR